MKKIIKGIGEFGRQLSEANIVANASSMAFFLFLSLVPILIIIFAVIPYTPLTENDILTALYDFTPTMSHELLATIVRDVYSKSKGLLSIAIVTTIWSAASGVLAMIRGLNSVHKVEEKRNFIVLRIIAIFYMLIMLTTIILSLIINVFGMKIVDLILLKLPQFMKSATLIMCFRFLVVWLILSFAFTMIYTYVPSVKLKFKKCFLGGSFSAVVWTLFTYIFSIYVGRTGAFSVYGSISIIVLIMVWMYFSMYVLLLGASLNRFIYGEEQLKVKKK